MTQTYTLATAPLQPTDPAAKSVMPRVHPGSFTRRSFRSTERMSRIKNYNRKVQELVERSEGRKEELRRWTQVSKNFISELYGILT